MNREDFPMLNKDIVYFDNAATTFKPKVVIEKMIEYYTQYSSNAHRGDYNISFKVNDEVDETREIVKDFINAERKEEIIFTSGTTESMNMIVSGYFKKNLMPGDEVILSKSEHASNLLPWLSLAVTKGIIIKYVPLDENNKIDVNSLNKMITAKTKVISLAYITNVIGDIRKMNEISNICKLNNIYFVVDAAQSIGHIKTDVQYLDADFLVFSAHKMCGPTGVGVLYGKYEYLAKMMPVYLGGGMNESYTDDSIMLKKLPERLEAGTPNLAGIIAFKEAIKYIENIGLNNIHEYVVYLKSYLLNEIKDLDYIEIINKKSESGIIALNVKDVFAGDLALILNDYNICVRAGSHCVKTLKEETGVANTVRISLYFYNTIEEIDYLIKILKNKDILYKT